ncbi:MAG: extracellular solute-binding protein, partial [Alphaproteobacteria bacterium]|nr:extracellular solute-binding protein [Alphaproteobacteria bacterium]
MLKDKAYDEFPDKLSAHAITPNELSRVIDFLEQVELETEQELGVRRGNQELRMLAFLMRNHLAGRQTTQTTLIQASGLTYGTALRVLEDLVDRGTVIKRPRTKTGRSFSLHPSPDHIKQWKVLSRRIKGIVSGVVGWRKQNKVVDDYYFGSSYMCASVIQAPSALPEPLPVSKVRMLLHADPTFLAMSSVKRQFEELIGTNIEIKTHSIDRLYREIYNNSQLNRSKYDIVACDITWVGEMASRKVILPNNDFFGDDEFSLNDFHPTSTSCATFNDQYYGVPIHTAPELFLYRKDLFEEAGLQAPTTTGSVLEAVKALHNPNKGLSGIAWNAASGTPLGHTFCMVMAAFGQPIINLRVGEGSFHSDQLNRDDFRPQFLSNAAFETANYLLELMDYSPSNIFSMSWYERAKCYANGDCAMAYCYSLLASMFLNDKDSPTYGVTNFLPHPHGPKGTPIAP